MEADLKITEKEFMAQVIQLLKLFHWLYYHTYRSTRSPEGFPDIVAVRDNRVLFIEIKTNKGRLTEAQKEWITALHESGVEVYLWRPAFWESIVEKLK